MTSHESTIIREPVIEDVDALRPTLQHWIRDRETGAVLPYEVLNIELSIAASIAEASSQRFLVAEKAGKAVGIMGVQPPEGVMLGRTTTEHPAELITALVSPDDRIQGVGKALLGALTERAIAEGVTELIVNSGPRYEETGWPFWTSQFGEPDSVAYDYYGEGGHAMVWRKILD